MIIAKVEPRSSFNWCLNAIRGWIKANCDQDKWHPHYANVDTHNQPIHLFGWNEVMRSVILWQRSSGFSCRTLIISVEIMWKQWTIILVISLDDSCASHGVSFKDWDWTSWHSRIPTGQSLSFTTPLANVQLQFLGNSSWAGSHDWGISHIMCQPQGWTLTPDDVTLAWIISF